MNLMKHRKLWYWLSLVFIVPGMLSIVLWGLKPSIDFTGGSKIEINGTQDVEGIKKLAEDNSLESTVVQKLDKDTVSLRSKGLDENKRNEVVAELKKLVGDEQASVVFETVGPSVSAEVTRNSFIAVAIASLVIIIYIAFSFRRVPYPAKSWEFGVGAVLATIHDAIFLIGAFSILGHFYNVEVDPLIVTAILTIIGFSVHDTIVIFDRIRENLIRKGSEGFESVVNLSVLEMLPRTLNTSFLAWVLLFILFLFGGETIRWFVFALMIGMISGTYSSILTASPLLVTWDEFKAKRKR